MRRFDARLRAVAVWDEVWCVRLNGASSVPGVCPLFRTVSRLGDGVFWYVLMGGLLAAGGWYALEPVLHMIAVGAVAMVVYKTLKSTTSRPRPYQVRAQIRAAAAPLDQFSFPSGHTLHAVAFSIVAIAYFPALAWLLGPFSLLVALSRVVLGLHYPTDVMAGAAIGALLACASFLVV